MHNDLGIDIATLFQNVCKTLVLSPGCTYHAFPAPHDVLAARDYDGHRDKRGFMRYEGAYRVTVGGRAWAIAHGTPIGAYPIDPYAGDLAALPLDKVTDAAIPAFFAETLPEYFEGTLIITMRSGQFGFPSETIFPPVTRLLRANLDADMDRFVAQEREVDESVIDIATMRAATTNAVRYSFAFAHRLAKHVQTALATVP